MRKIFLAIGLSALAVCNAFAADPQKAKGAAAAVEKPRIAYTAIRIVDADKSLKFYELLGMKERQRIPLDGGVQEILIGFGDPNKDAGLLLLFNPNHKEPYTHGDAYH